MVALLRLFIAKWDTYAWMSFRVIFFRSLSLKDDNIFVSEKGEYKIGDFGVSKVLKDSSKAESLLITLIPSQTSGFSKIFFRFRQYTSNSSC